MDNIKQVEGKDQIITDIDMHPIDASVAGIDVNLPHVNLCNQVQNVMLWKGIGQSLL